MVIIAQAPASATLSFAAVASTVATTAVFNVIAGEPGAGSQNNLNMIGSNRLNGQQFVVRASGLMSYAAGTYTVTVQPLICIANTASFAAVAANAVYSAAAQAVTVSSAAVTNLPWEAEITLAGDNTSGKLSGYFKGSINNGANQLVSLAAATNLPTSVSFLTEPPLQFAAALVSSGNLSVGTASLLQFTVEA